MAAALGAALLTTTTTTTTTTAAAAAPATAAAPVVLLHVGRGPAQARTDLVGDDLDDAALLAVVGLPRALLEASRDDNPRAFADRLGDVLGHLAPAHDVEERGLFFPLGGLAVLPPSAHGDGEGRLRRAVGGVTDLRIPRHVSYDGDGAIGHARTSR